MKLRVWLNSGSIAEHEPDEKPVWIGERMTFREGGKERGYSMLSVAKWELDD